MTNTHLNRRGFLSLAGATLALTGAGSFTMRSARAQSGFSLTVLHINDMHSRISEISRFNSSCSDDDSADGKCFGGSARLATAIREIRAEHESAGRPVLTLDAGDQSQGTLYYTTYGGKAEIQMMNAIGFDAMGVGNHEFNRGPEKPGRDDRGGEFPRCVR